jgi:hypothetical protein
MNWTSKQTIATTKQETRQTRLWRGTTSAEDENSMVQRNILYNVGVGVRLDSPYYIHLSGSLRTTKQTQEQRHQPITYLTTESVDGASLTLEGIYDIEGCDGLSLGVLGVGDSIADDAFKEDLEDTSGFFVDETGDTFDTTTTSETADSGFRDSLCK